MLKKIGIGAAAFVAAITLAAPAHADDASYLDYLRSHGQNIMGYGPVENDWVTAGHFACARLRDGETPEQAANHPQHAFQDNGPLVVDAARHELCPDKL
ncbi:DUF732 domain-containing protein [Mycobacterium talmoniae]|uniref:DUF732 domain-containing protein n=1 Tax=Mycobacterium talmoniae TaxID=1858794 RepID=A0A1S1NBV4_9MYCO|nr:MULTISPECIES: DUF732 domain-containing protein [Mycobacterium]OHU97055.1 hypothetical protein BKN37_22280 [Mycobacterium talmoniae]PQM47528.1 hypothetical protein C1Y40_02276 [Mycobacterium talmoniae]